MLSMGAWPAATKKVLEKWKQSPARECRPPLKYVGFKEEQIIGNMTARGGKHTEVNSHQEHNGFSQHAECCSFYTHCMLQQ